MTTRMVLPVSAVTIRARSGVTLDVARNARSSGLMCIVKNFEFKARPR